MPLLFTRYTVPQHYPHRVFFVFPVVRNSSFCVRTASDVVVGIRNFQNLKVSPEGKNGLQKSFKIFEAILPLFEGNMLYSLSAVVAEYLYLLYR